MRGVLSGILAAFCAFSAVAGGVCKEHTSGFTKCAEDSQVQHLKRLMINTFRDADLRMLALDIILTE